MSRDPRISLALQDDQLLLAGQPVAALAARHGTPLYLYDGDHIKTRINWLRNLIPNYIKILYAIKANPFAPLLRHLAGLTDGMDAASSGECQAALNAGVAAAAISFAGPGKRDDELRFAIERGILLVAESLDEIERIARSADACGATPRLMLRLNPDFELGRAGMKMGGGPRPFGLDSERAPAAIARLQALDIRLAGFHVYAGSQMLDAHHVIATQNAVADLLCRLAATVPDGVQALNLGGGFGIPYFPGEQPLDRSAVAANLHRLGERVHARLGPVQLVLELGRYLVGEAGVYVTRVLERKGSRGTLFLICDGGMHHHLAASGNFGQVLRRNFPVVRADRVYAGERERVQVVGPLCTPLDLLGKDLEIGRCEAGAVVAVLQSGAYGYSASPLGFLSHPRPKQLLLTRQPVGAQ